MFRFEIGTEDLLNSRFAVSPLSELTSLLRKLKRVDDARLPVAWGARLRPVFRRLRKETELDALLALKTRRYGAAFVAPPPSSLAQTIADDLAVVRATPLRQARREIDTCLRAQPTDDAKVLAVLRDRAVVDVLAETLDVVWHELVGPDWPALRAGSRWTPAPCSSARTAAARSSTSCRRQPSNQPRIPRSDVPRADRASHHPYAEA